MPFNYCYFCNYVIARAQSAKSKGHVALCAMLLIICAILITFSACDKNRIYEQNVELTNEGWYIDSVLTFCFYIQDTSQRYNIYYNIRNANTYPYYNLYVKYYFEDSVGSTLSTYIHERFLFDVKTGRPIVKRRYKFFGLVGIGDIFDHRFKLLNDLKFNHPGTYKIIMKQYMRQDPLPGILAVGIRVEIGNN